MLHHISVKLIRYPVETSTPAQTSSHLRVLWGDRIWIKVALNEPIKGEDRRHDHDSTDYPLPRSWNNPRSTRARPPVARRLKTSRHDLLTSGSRSIGKQWAAKCIDLPTIVSYIRCPITAATYKRCTTGLRTCPSYERSNAPACTLYHSPRVGVWSGVQRV